MLLVSFVIIVRKRFRNMNRGKLQQLVCDSFEIRKGLSMEGVRASETTPNNSLSA
jgi:hypothetical protein